MATDEDPAATRQDDRDASYEPGAVDDEGAAGPLDEHGRPVLQRPFFPHPQWTVGVVLVIAVVMLLLGVAGHPVWLLIGSPFILTLAVWVAVRIVERRRRRQRPPV